MMTKEELTQKRKDLWVKYKKGLVELDQEYAFANNNIEIGDFVQSTLDNKIIKVEAIYACVPGNELPYCRYNGPIYNSDLTPTNDSMGGTAYQTHLIVIKKANLCSQS